MHCKCTAALLQTGTGRFRRRSVCSRGRICERSGSPDGGEKLSKEYTADVINTVKLLNVTSYGTTQWKQALGIQCTLQEYMGAGRVVGW